MEARIEERVRAGEVKRLRQCIAFCGPTSTGKTYKAYALLKRLEFPTESVYLKAPSNLWWDGYDPAVHRAVVVEEFGRDVFNGALHSMWLQILNPEPYVQLYRAEIKGRHTLINPEIIIFTSITSPESWIQSVDHADSGEQYVTRLHVVQCKKVFPRKASKLSDAAVKAALLSVLSSSAV